MKVLPLRYGPAQTVYLFLCEKIDTKECEMPRRELKKNKPPEIEAELNEFPKRTELSLEEE